MAVQECLAASDAEAFELGILLVRFLNVKIYVGTHAMASDYGWNQHMRIVDIGGAYGSFIGHLLTVHKKPRGVLFDQPQARILHLIAPRAFSPAVVILESLA